MAAWSNNPGLALGNGVGSIIVDTGLILGGSCLFFNVPIDRFILNRTGWVQVLSATFLVIIALVQKYVFHRPILDRWVGVLFMALLIFYLYLTYKWSKKSSFIQTKQENATSHIKASLKVVIGLFFCGRQLKTFDNLSSRIGKATWCSRRCHSCYDGCIWYITTRIYDSNNCCQKRPPRNYGWQYSWR